MSESRRLKRYAVVAACALPLGCVGNIESQDQLDVGAGTQPSPSSAPAAVDDTGPKDGPGLYQAHCLRCHGVEGSGSDVAPEVQHPAPDYFRWVVRHGLEGGYESPMLPVDGVDLADVELELVLDYLSGLPQPSTDEGLYLDYCANCHAADARGGVAHKNIAGKDELLEVVRRGKGGDNYAARTRYMPGWSQGELDSERITLLEDYVGQLAE